MSDDAASNRPRQPPFPPPRGACAPGSAAAGPQLSTVVAREVELIVNARASGTSGRDVLADATAALRDAGARVRSHLTAVAGSQRSSLVARIASWSRFNSSCSASLMTCGRAPARRPRG